MATLLLANQAGGSAALTGSRKRFTCVVDSMAVLTLTDKGMIRECNEAVGRLFAFQTGQLIWQHVSVLLPQLAEIALLQDGQVNPRLLFLSRMGHRFKATSLDGTSLAIKLFFRCVENSGRRYLRVILRPAEE